MELVEAPVTTDELVEVLGRAETTADVAAVHNATRAAGLFEPDELWEACAARWAEIEAGQDHRATRTHRPRKPSWMT